LAQLDFCLKYILDNEKGFVDNPKDPGGATNFGITLKLLSDFRGHQCSVEDLKVIQMPEVEAVYKKYFWVPLQLETVPQIQATCFMDFAVNRGNFNAIKALQQALGFAVVDGKMGPKTLASLCSTNAKDFIYKFVGRCQGQYIDIVIKNPIEIEFLDGWLKRPLKMFNLLEVK
jgi:lysozyme family protein